MKNKIVSLKSIKKIDNGSKRYDIEVKDNHNFFANNILVHNSLGILFFAEKKWRIATGGSFASEQANWANKYLEEKIIVSYLEKGVTYLLEIIYPENRIVVPYSEKSLYLLSAYKNGYELTGSQLSRVANLAWFSLPQTYDFNELDKILQRAKILDYTNEGFVIRFKNGVRVKVKGDEYCRIHKLISRVTPIAIWEMLLSDDNMEEIKKDLPEEMESDYDQILSIIKKSMRETIEGINNAYKVTKHLSDKELGLEISNKDSKFFKDEKVNRFKSYIFQRRKESFDEQFNNVDSSIRRKIFRSFRPKSNVLEGYVPSTAMNRFQSDIN